MYNSYANMTFKHKDEIKIPYNSNLYTLSCKSFIYVEERLTIKKRNNEEEDAMLGNNCVAFMLDEI